MLKLEQEKFEQGVVSIVGAVENFAKSKSRKSVKINLDALKKEFDRSKRIAGPWPDNAGVVINRAIKELKALGDGNYADGVALLQEIRDEVRKTAGDGSPT